MMKLVRPCLHSRPASWTGRVRLNQVRPVARRFIHRASTVWFARRDRMTEDDEVRSLAGVGLTRTGPQIGITVHLHTGAALLIAKDRATTLYVPTTYISKHLHLP